MNFITATQPVRDRKWLGYLLAVLLSALALWLRFKLDASLAGFPFLTFFIAVIFTALLGGLGPGVLSMILTGLLAAFFFMGGNDGGLSYSFSDTVVLGFYWLNTGTIVALMHGMLSAYNGQLRSDEALRVLNLELESRIEARTAELENEVAERSAAESQVRQLQKMESIGQLTGGIAHDFNNMLAIVIGSLDMAKRRLDGSEHPRVAFYIDNASEGARRAAVLTSRLLAFSRQQPLAPQALDANQLVSGMSELLRRAIGEQIRVEAVLAGGLWRAFADPAQLENALINLAVNGRDAMPGGGKLTIETANAELDDRYARQHADVQAGQYVLVCVTDSGIGMPQEVLERAFDPFYTTKGVGKGTGLGLSQVFGYVKQSGGHLKIYSEIGQGTTVKLYLPRHHGQATFEPRKETRETLPLGSAGEIILVVEDEAEVRRMTVDALRELGYSVIQASDARQALEQLQLQPHVDLLFTDIVMPEMNGRQLADKVRETNARIRILFTTGYTRNAVVHNGMLDAGVAFLPKPFTIEQLANKVRDVLSGAGSNRLG